MLPRELIAASTEPLILNLLAKGESYGYAIIREISARSDGKIQWTDGMLYPVLHRLEQKGLIDSRWSVSESGHKRKYYSLRRPGRIALDRHRADWTFITGVLNGEHHV